MCSIMCAWQYISSIEELMHRSDHHKVTLHERDWQTLSRLLASADDLPAAAKLKARLRGAKVLLVGLLPRDVVTLGSSVCILDTETGVESTVTLVLPQNTQSHSLAISVLSDFGIELFGLRKGNILQWDAADGSSRQLKIVGVDQRAAMPGCTAKSD